MTAAIAYDTRSVRSHTSVAIGNGIAMNTTPGITIRKGTILSAAPARQDDAATSEACPPHYFQDY